MSNRPRYYKPYVLKNSKAKIPKSTEYYQRKKFPNNRYHSTSSSDSSWSNEDLASTSSWISSIYIGEKVTENDSHNIQYKQSDFHNSMSDDSSDFGDSATEKNVDSSASDDDTTVSDYGCCVDTAIPNDEPPDRCNDSSCYDTGYSDNEEVLESTNEMALDEHHEDSHSSDKDETSSASSEEDDEDPSIEDIFRNLIEFLGKKESNEPIDAKLVVNRAELLLAVLTFSAFYKLPNDGIANLCRMMNALLPSNVLPQTKYLIDQLFNSEEGIEYYAMCPKCGGYVGQFTRQDRSIDCKFCKTRILLKGSYRDFFVTFDITPNLRELIESNWEYYISVISGGRHVDGKLRDINDGRVYIEFVRSLPEEVRLAYLTFLCNADGAAMYKGTKFSLWPIWVIPNEIPIRIRNSQPIPAALWYGRSKPNMTHFLRAFVNRMNKLSTIGFSCQVGDEVKCIKAFAICFCVDCMARYAMQGGTVFHGYFSCSWCLHPGVLIHHKKGNAMKFPIMERQPLPRTELESLWHIQQALESGPDNFGFQNASPVLNLHGMIITDGFVPDHMHQLDFGTTKQLTDYRIEKRGQIFSLKKNQISQIDEYLKSLRLPSILERLTRSIHERKIWNSREWENWLLYYSLPILMEVEGYSVFVQHWEHLVGGSYIILKDEIDLEELQIADKRFKTFLFMTEHLYSKDAMSYNVHQTGEHLVQAVANWGPAAVHSGYPFESGNGDLKKKVKAANGVIHQLNRSICRDRSLPILRKHIESLCEEKDEKSPVLDFCHHLQNGNTQKSEKVGQNRYFRQSSIRKTVLEKHGLSDKSLAYNKLVRDKCVFQRRTKRQSRSDDSFVTTSDGSFIKIEKFIIDSSNKNEWTLCRRVHVQDIFPNAPQMKIITAIDDEKVTIDTNSIVKCCVMMEVNDKRYICPVPNMHLY